RGDRAAELLDGVALGEASVERGAPLGVQDATGGAAPSGCNVDLYPVVEYLPCLPCSRVLVVPGGRRRRRDDRSFFPSYLFSLISRRGPLAGRTPASRRPTRRAARRNGAPTVPTLPPELARLMLIEVDEVHPLAAVRL